MILSITGLIGSGKDTIADYLCTYYGFKKLSFAASLKDAVSLVFGWDRFLLEGTTKESREWRETVDSWWAERLNMPHLTPRWVLQYWGTEVCRNGFHQEIWIASLENKIRTITEDIVITDCRFPNEIEMVKKLNGISVRVERGPRPIWYSDALSFNKGPTHIGWALARQTLEAYNVHPSEYCSIGLEYDHIIDNNGTIWDLHNKVKSILDL